MRQIPFAPLFLGLAGLIPFWGLAVMLFASNHAGLDLATVDRALATYAAVIISFLGGIRWGLAARDETRGGTHFVLSVLPSLAGWALLAAPEPWRLAGLGALAIGLGPIDARLVSEGLAPRWLGRLRMILSTGARTALLLGVVGTTRV